MSDVFADDREASLFGARLNRVPDVADPVADDRLGNAAIEALFGAFHQSRRFSRDATDRKGLRAVAVIAAVQSADVDLDEVSLFQDPRTRGDSVDDFGINADTGAPGEAGVAEKTRLCPAFYDLQSIFY